VTRQCRAISADGHTIEPPHTWETYLPKEFHDRMPRPVKDPQGGDGGSWSGVRPPCRSGW
jgi:hypothetical protein